MNRKLKMVCRHESISLPTYEYHLNAHENGGDGTMIAFQHEKLLDNDIKSATRIYDVIIKIN